MNYMSWTIDGAGRDEALAARALACETFHLCATVGCRCAAGDGDKLCTESELAGNYPVLVSDGPGWHVSAVCLAGSVVVSLYFELQVLGAEARRFHERLMEFGKPLFLSTGGPR